MRTDFTNISNALTNLVNAIADAHNALLEKANAERKEALALYARMNATKEDLDTLAKIAGNAAAELAGVDTVATEHAMKIYDAITEGFDAIPECDYEDFYDFCYDCGACLTYEDKFEVTTDGEVLCAECLETNYNVTDEDETDEVEEA